MRCESSSSASCKSVVKEMIDRLDEHMTLEQSRGEAKEQAKRAGTKTWAFSTGNIHSYKTSKSIRNTQSTS
jgi:hypothetical protein